jgi:hypothetical protein
MRENMMRAGWETIPTSLKLSASDIIDDTEKTISQTTGRGGRRQESGE